MIATTNFFIWFFSGLGGIGGWLLLAAASFLAVLFLFISSLTRKMPALAWRLAATLLALLVLPAAIYRFVPNETQATLESYKEIIFYLGIIGGIVPLFVALGYFLRFQGLVVCPNGHAYDPKLGDCPECIRMPAPPDISGVQDFMTELGGEQPSGSLPDSQSPISGETPEDGYSPGDMADTEPVLEGADFGSGISGVPTGVMTEAREFIETQIGRVGLPMKSKQKSQSFLLLPDNHTYQLNQGLTNIGRSADNDFVFVNEFVSRNHARIVEEERNIFRLHDLASANGTWLNGKRIKQSVLLESDDEIRFGDEVTVLFLTSSRR
jgi:hypothetical protein